MFGTGFEFLVKGGPVMIALIACSVIALAIILERMLSLSRKRVIKLTLLKEIESSLNQGDLSGALDWCKEENSPMMRIAKVALINYQKPKNELRTVIEEAGRLEVSVLEKFLSTLNTIAVISPLLGLLGTVTGMINVFQTIVSEGMGNPTNLAGGISEALITTATGLSIAIPILVFHNYFSNKADRLLVDMERHSLTMLEILSRKK